MALTTDENGNITVVPDFNLDLSNSPIYSSSAPISIPASGGTNVSPGFALADYAGRTLAENSGDIEYMLRSGLQNGSYYLHKTFDPMMSSIGRALGLVSPQSATFGGRTLSPQEQAIIDYRLVGNRFSPGTEAGMTYRVAPEYLYGNQEFRGLKGFLDWVWNGSKRNQNSNNNSSGSTSSSGATSTSTGTTQANDSTTTVQPTREVPQTGESGGSDGSGGGNKNNKSKYGKLALALALAGEPAAMALIGGTKDARTKDPLKRKGAELLRWGTIPGLTGQGIKYAWDNWLTGYDDEKEQSNNIIGYLPDGTPITSNDPSKSTSTNNNQPTTRKDDDPMRD